MIKVIDTFQEVELLCKSKAVEELTRHIIFAADKLLQADSDLNHLEITQKLEWLFPTVSFETLNEFVVARAICLSKDNCLRHPFLRDTSLLTTARPPIHADQPIVFVQSEY